MSRWSRWWAGDGQRRHHRPFRIPEPELTGGARVRLAQLLEELAQLARDRTPAMLGEKKLAEAATNLWRARRRLARLDGADTREATRVGRYLRNTQEELDAAGLRIQDHDGAEFHHGLSLEVVAYQDDPARCTRTVVETMRPTIYLAGRLIQMGQVIVAQPADPETHSCTEEPRV